MPPFLIAVLYPNTVGTATDAQLCLNSIAIWIGLCPLSVCFWTHLKNVSLCVGPVGRPGSCPSWQKP